MDNYNPAIREQFSPLLREPDHVRLMAELALAGLPDWFVSYVNNRHFAVGMGDCGHGDALPVLAAQFDPHQLAGFAQTESELEEARRRYPSGKFKHESELEGRRNGYGLMYLSGAHDFLNDPFTWAERHAESISEFVWMIVPFAGESPSRQEGWAVGWHDLPATIAGRFRLIHLSIQVAPYRRSRFWCDRYLVLLYATDTATESLNHKTSREETDASLLSFYQSDFDPVARIRALLDTYALFADSRREEELGDLPAGAAPEGRVPPDAWAEGRRAVDRGRYRRRVDQLLLENLQIKGGASQAASTEIVRLRQELERHRESLNERDVALAHLKYEKRAREFRLLQLKSWLRRIVEHPVYGFFVRLRQRFSRSRGAKLEDVINVASDPDAETLKREAEAATPIPTAETPKYEQLYPNLLGRYDREAFRELLKKRLETARGLFVQSATIDWNVPLYQRPQQIACAMADIGYVVVYLTENQARDDVHGFEEYRHNLFVTDQIEFLNEVENAIVSFYSTSAVYSIDDIEAVRSRNNIVIYEYIDHIDESISGDNADTLRRLFKAIDGSTVDIIVPSAGILRDEISDRVPEDRICMLPNGVDIGHYDRVLESAGEPPEKIRRVTDSGRPVVGYFGALAPWLWYELINSLTGLRRDLEFVFIGPDYFGAKSQMVRRDNVHLTGLINYHELPAAARCFDAAIIPFQPGQIAQTTSPLKVFEYFALEKPVVVTSDMAECTRFERVLSAGTAEEFAAKIDEAIEMGRTDEYRQWARRTAEENSWEQRAKTLVEHVERYAKERKNG